MEAAMVSDDEHDNDKITTPTSHQEGESEPSEDDPGPPMRQTPMTFDLNMDKNKSSAPVQIEDDKEDTQKHNHSAEFFIFGPDASTLKGKSTRPTPKKMYDDFFSPPEELYQQNQSNTVCNDHMEIKNRKRKTENEKHGIDRNLQTVFVT
ncbi:unnamed protein product [Cylindrotheca closterium]|uniref:Uncharacterized protein n=1 Tax=Cylindrotheca closterium TaxID=2856 RepID=A0AAD2CDS1_9STRA|nr:unnamed protein product [Cylindrotheca closterium]